MDQRYILKSGFPHRIPIPIPDDPIPAEEPSADDEHFYAAVAEQELTDTFLA